MVVLTCSCSPLASTFNFSQHLIIDLDHIMNITSIGTQGRAHCPEYYSDLKEIDGNIKIFKGNKDGNTFKLNKFGVLIMVQWIRINCQQHCYKKKTPRSPVRPRRDGASLSNFVSRPTMLTACPCTAVAPRVTSSSCKSGQLNAAQRQPKPWYNNQPVGGQSA